MSLIWSRPRWTCFSVAVNSPMSDISCRTGQAGLVSDSWNFAVRVCHQFRVGSDLALIQVKLLTYEVENLLGVQL